MSDSLKHAQAWAHEYVMHPAANREVVKLIGTIPPVAHRNSSEAQTHETYSKLMGNVADHHAQEWFKAGDKDEFHESAHHLTQNYLEEHNGTWGL